MNAPAHRKDVLGRAGEEAAVRYLTRLGWQVIERNWRSPDGELDIIAFDGSEHVVCEVKTRRSLRYGAPAEAVTTAKAHRLRRLAGCWAARHGVPGGRVRVDVIGLVGDGHERGPDHPDGFAVDHLRAVC